MKKNENVNKWDLQHDKDIILKIYVKIIKLGIMYIKKTNKK